MRGLECVDAQTFGISRHSLFQVARTVNPVLDPAEADAVWSWCHLNKPLSYRRKTAATS